MIFIDLVAVWNYNTIIKLRKYSLFVSIDVKKVLFTCIYVALRTCKLQCGTTRRECIMFRVSKLIKKKKKDKKINKELGSGKVPKEVMLSSPWLGSLCAQFYVHFMACSGRNLSGYVNEHGPPGLPLSDSSAGTSASLDMINVDGFSASKGGNYLTGGLRCTTKSVWVFNDSWQDVNKVKRHFKLRQTIFRSLITNTAVIMIMILIISICKEGHI